MVGRKEKSIFIGELKKTVLEVISRTKKVEMLKFFGTENHQHSRF